MAREGFQLVPLLEGSVTNSRESTPEMQSTLPVSTPMQYWTNTDVVMWLLKIDQKVFVPAAILRNISGKTLLDLKFEQLEDSMNIPKDTPPQEMQSLSTLYNHIDAMRTPIERKVGETWGTDEGNEETYGRLTAHPSGWTYDREYNEWVDYLELSGENAITINIEANLKHVQSRMQLIVLVASAIASLVTSIQMSTTAEQTLDGGRLVKSFQMTLKVILLVTTFFVTMTSGYAQVRGPAWKEQLAAAAEYQAIAEKLLGVYEDNLSAPLDDRVDFAAYQAQVKTYWVALDAVRINASPHQRNSALKDIKANDPTTWKKVFEFQEVGRQNCQVCCPVAIELSEPVGDNYDYMLMRFSGEDMGEYTSTPEMFKKDKKDARKGLEAQQKLLGSSVQ